MNKRDPFVKFSFLRGHKFRLCKVSYGKDIKILGIQIGYWGFVFDFGIRTRKRMWEELHNKQFNKVCEVCHKPLTVNSWLQNVRFHKECRKLRNKKI